MNESKYVILNKFFKVDKNSVTKNKLIRDIFEIDDNYSTNLAPRKQEKITVKTSMPSTTTTTKSKNNTSSSFHLSNDVNLEPVKQPSQPDLLFIPCINCSNMIYIEDVENHSNICLVVTEKVNSVENSKFSFHISDFKLKKLSEHIINIQSLDGIKNEKSKTDLTRDLHYFHLLGQTLKDTISIVKISSSSISLLKKYIINLDVSLI